jgi:hypothetical protein
MLYKHSILEKAENRILLDVGIRFLMYVFWVAFLATMFSLFHHQYHVGDDRNRSASLRNLFPSAPDAGGDWAMTMKAGTKQSYPKFTFAPSRTIRV